MSAVSYLRVRVTLPWWAVAYVAALSFLAALGADIDAKQASERISKAAKFRIVGSGRK